MSLRCPTCESEIPWDPDQTSSSCPSCGCVVGYHSSQMMESSESLACLETQSMDDVVELATMSPARIGRYRVVKFLGQGGFGDVFLTRDEELERDVAIKVPRPGRFGSRSAFLSFVEEARLAASLKHPAIVGIYDIGCNDDVGCFIAMEYIPGVTLASMMAKGSMSNERIADIVANAARAVHYAHQKGITHRDLKPSNLIIDENDEPHILDFGLGILDDEQWDRDGEVAGTPAYMPPEQIRGDTPALDGRADIWSLGVILYQALTGRLPFSGDSKRVLKASRTYDPKPLRQIDDSIPVDLEEITLKCLAKSPRERYATAFDLASALEAWVRSGLVRTSATNARASYPQRLVACAGITLALIAVYMVGSITRDDSSSDAVHIANNDAQQIALSGNADVAPVIRAHILNDMLAHEPKEVMFPHAQPAAVYKYNSELHTVTLVSRSDSIFLTGKATVRDFEIRVGIACNQPPGGTGLIFGVNREPAADDVERWIGQGVLLKALDEERFIVARYALRLEPYREGSLYVAERQLLRSEPVGAPGDRECMLTIRVDNGSLDSIRWDNQPLNALCNPAIGQADLMMQRPVPLLNTGEFGLWSYFGGTVFQDHFYLPQEEEQ